MPCLVFANVAKQVINKEVHEALSKLYNDKDAAATALYIKHCLSLWEIFNTRVTKQNIQDVEKKYATAISFFEDWKKNIARHGYDKEKTFWGKEVGVHLFF